MPWLVTVMYLPLYKRISHSQFMHLSPLYIYENVKGRFEHTQFLQTLSASSAAKVKGRRVDTVSALSAWATRAEPTRRPSIRGPRRVRWAGGQPGSPGPAASPQERPPRGPRRPRMVVALQGRCSRDRPWSSLAFPLTQVLRLRVHIAWKGF